jgi:tetratricopeptide (TPR) repeat protein
MGPETQDENSPENNRPLKAAEEHLAAGRRGEAEAACREVLVNQPDDPDAFHLLGGVLLLDGRAKEAVEVLRRAVRLRPGNGVFLTNLGAALLAAGEMTEAEDALRWAIDMRPDMAPAHDSLARVLTALGRDDDAVTSFERAVALDGNFIKARRALAKTLLAQGRLAPAVIHLEEILKRRPDDGDALVAMAQVCMEASFGGRAVAYLERALRGDPDNALLHCYMGQALNECGLGELALGHLRHAAVNLPDKALPYIAMTDALASLGRLEEAQAANARAFQIEPRSVEACFQRAHIRGADQDKAEITFMEDILADPGLDDGARSRLHFALGKSLDVLGRFDTAFDHFQRANVLRKASFERDRYAELLKAAKETFPSQFFQKRQDFGLDSPVPVFIFGMARSGTTLVEQIIASHPQVFGGGELMDIPHLSFLLPGLLGKPYPECVAKMDGPLSKNLAGACLRRLTSLNPAAARVTNKMPGNFPHLGLIALLFPNAPLIRCRRDPRDTCLSCYFTSFRSGSAYSFDLEDTVYFWRGYDDLMDHWQTVLPSRILEVNYEDLVDDPESVSRRIIDHCGLDWDERCLDFNQTSRPVLTASREQVRQPIYRTSVARWRNYEKHLGPLLEALTPQR